jgi:hypothetical protein
LRRRCGRPLEITSVVRGRSAVDMLVSVIAYWAGFVGVRFFDVGFVIVTVISRFSVWI